MSSLAKDDNDDEEEEEELCLRRVRKNILPVSGTGDEEGGRRGRGEDVGDYHSVFH